MSYQVLARKWRPQRFEEMVGQEHVLKALMNALDKDRLHHAYLFTGTRGVGKTTIARILARSLNCEQGVSSRPCGACSACQQISDGRFVDLIEVDAASRTKVDDTRELLDNVQYKPTVGRYKVYLIDEVHMLSTHSFNALLKTLEEPPPHVKFLLATTDPQKVPVTVLSRCLQFNLKRVPEDMIARHLEDILQRESVEFDTGAVKALAHAADGSIRDGMSLLDQAIAFGDGEVRQDNTFSMLGTVTREHQYQIVAALASGDATGSMQLVEEMANSSPDYKQVTSELISFFHELALAQLAPSVVESRVNDAEVVLDLAAQISAEEIQLWYEIAIQGQKNLEISPTPRQGFEMLLLRMLAFSPQGHTATSTGSVPPRAKVTVPVISAPPAAEVQSKASTDAVVAIDLPTAAPESVEVPAALPGKTESDLTPGGSEVSDEAGILASGDSASSVGEASLVRADGAASAAYNEIEPPPFDDYSFDDFSDMQAAEEEPVADRSAAPAAVEHAIAAPAAAVVHADAYFEEISGELDEWETLLRALNLPGMVRTFAANCRLLSQSDGVFTLAIARRNELLVSASSESKLAEALSAHLGHDVRIQLETVVAVTDSPAEQAIRRAERAQLQAEASIAADPLVQRIKDSFNASVVAGSVEPRHPSQ